MSDITVYGIPGSPFLRSVEIGLREKGVDYQFVPVNPGELKTPDYIEQRHPFGRIPAFEHEGFRIYETQAILRYIDQVFPDPALTPADPKERARMNQVIGIIEWYLFPKAAAPIAFNRIIGPRLLGIPGNEEAIAEAMPMGRTCFAELDRLLGAKPYFAGNQVSLADIMLAAQLDLFNECAEGRELIGGTANLKPWLARMLARTSFVATEPPQLLREAA